MRKLLKVNIVFSLSLIFANFQLYTFIIGERHLKTHKDQQRSSPSHAHDWHVAHKQRGARQLCQRSRKKVNFSWFFHHKNLLQKPEIFISIFQFSKNVYTEWKL